MQQFINNGFVCKFLVTVGFIPFFYLILRWSLEHSFFHFPDQHHSNWIKVQGKGLKTGRCNSEKRSDLLLSLVLPKLLILSYKANFILDIFFIPFKTQKHNVTKKGLKRR